MFILKKGHQPGVYMPLRALFLVHLVAASSSILKDKQSEHELHITYNEKLE